MKEGEFPCTGRLLHRQAQGGAVESQKAGHIRAGNREKVALFQPIKSSRTMAPARWQARGTKRRPQKTHSTGGGPRGPGEARNTNLCSAHTGPSAEGGPGG